MKNILLSINPEWVVKILNGEKTIEIRKKFPKDYVGWVYIYCTKDGEKPRDGLIPYENKKGYCLVNKSMFPYDEYEEQGYRLINGKVVARFWCDRIDTHHILPTENILPFNKNVEEKLKQLCLTKEQVMNYGKGADYYAHLIHISKLEVFDKPKEISEFKYVCNKFYENKTGYSCIGCKYCNYDSEYPACYGSCKHYLTKAPQNYCYVEVE